MSKLDKAFYIYEIPLNFVRDITITACNDQKWSKAYLLA